MGGKTCCSVSVAWDDELSGPLYLHAVLYWKSQWMASLRAPGLAVRGFKHKQPTKPKQKLKINN